MRDNLLPLTRSVINSLISFLEKRPSLHKFVLSVARKHDDMIGYRKYGNLLTLTDFTHPFIRTLPRRYYQWKRSGNSGSFEASQWQGNVWPNFPSPTSHPIKSQSRRPPQIWTHQAWRSKRKVSASFGTYFCRINRTCGNMLKPFAANVMMPQPLTMPSPLVWKISFPLHHPSFLKESKQYLLFLEAIINPLFFIDSYYLVIAKICKISSLVRCAMPRFPIMTDRKPFYRGRDSYHSIHSIQFYF